MSPYGIRKNQKYGVLFVFEFMNNEIEVIERYFNQSFDWDDATF